jgi:multiple sugar transport system permease protein
MKAEEEILPQLLQPCEREVYFRFCYGVSVFIPQPEFRNPQFKEVLSARVDGATVPQIFWHIYIPLITPSLVAIGTYALLLAWNEYLYAFLFLSREAKLTVPVMLGHFTTSDDAPWTLMMASAVIYSLPPIALYYSVRRFMVTGLTAGSVKS